MAQYTYSFSRSEYERIPIQLKKQLDQLIAESNADEETKALVSAVCACMEKAIEDLSRYGKDQLRVW